MFKKLFMTLLIVAVFAGVSADAFGPPPRGRGPSVEKMIERIAKDLGLTPQQKDKYLAEAKQVEAAAKELADKNKALFSAIEKELLKDEPDSKTIYDRMQQISQNRTKIEFKRMEQMLKLRQELTPEQKAKFEKMMQQDKERGKARFEKMKKQGPTEKGPGGPEGPLGPGGPGGPEGPGGPDAK